MPSQGGDGNQGGPWGVRGGPSPDLEELLRQGQDRLKRIMPGGGPRGLGMILIFCFLLTALGVWSAFYTVPSDSVAVVQRFGKYLKEVQPGLNFKLPLGVEVVSRSWWKLVEAA
jgi:membrane protease subunit HflK